MHHHRVSFVFYFLLIYLWSYVNSVHTLGTLVNPLLERCSYHLLWHCEKSQVCLICPVDVCASSTTLVYNETDGCPTCSQSLTFLCVLVSQSCDFLKIFSFLNKPFCELLIYFFCWTWFSPVIQIISSSCVHTTIIAAAGICQSDWGQSLTCLPSHWCHLSLRCCQTVLGSCPALQLSPLLSLLQSVSFLLSSHC